MTLCMDYIFYLTFLCATEYVLSRSVSQTSPVSSVCSGPVQQGGRQIVECIVREGQTLDYRDVREWTAADQSGKGLHISIECLGGDIFLPWPYRARNVVSLRIQGCNVRGMFSEWNSTNTIPDALEYLEITNIVIYSSIKEMYERITNIGNYSSDFECGQRTLKYDLVRNVRYHFEVTEDDFAIYQQLMMQDPNDLFILNKPKSYKCVYPSLRYLENSGNPNIAKLHFKILEDRTEYPALEGYDLSNNSFTEIPVELRNIDFRLFPKLRRIDFSKNNIESIQLNFPVHNTAQNLIFIDMSSNSIRTIPKDIVDKLVRHENVLIDLRSNPLKCGCSLLQLRQYLIRRYSSPQLRVLREVTCEAEGSQPNSTALYRLLDSNFKTMFCDSI